MQSKYQGIDSRKIKCCSTNPNSIESGISFDEDEGIKMLRFHFLGNIERPNSEPILNQFTKTMHLNKKNIKQLIAELQQLL